MVNRTVSLKMQILILLEKDDVRELSQYWIEAELLY